MATVSLAVALALLVAPAVGHGSGAAAAPRACAPGWADVTSPRLRGGELASLAVVSANDVWAVGGVLRTNRDIDVIAAVPLIEHWDGARWAVVPSPRVRGALVDVAVSSNGDAWAVGWLLGGGTLLLHWDGTSWMRAALPAAIRDASTVTSVTAKDVWVAGGFYRAGRFGADVGRWDGSRWTRVAEFANSDLNGSVALPAGDVWLVGSAGSLGDSAGRAFATRWDGVRGQRTVFRRSSGADDAWLSTVAALSPTDVWAGGGEHLGEFSPGGIGTLLLHWNGARWARIKHPYVDDTAFVGLAPLPAGELWAISANPYDYRTNGGDGSWVWHRVGGHWHAAQLTGGRTLSAIAAVRSDAAAGSTVVWGVGQVGKGEGDNGFPLHTLPLIRRVGC